MAEVTKEHVELEKAKEVLRASLHLYRGSSYGSNEQRAIDAVKDAQRLADLSFLKIEALVK